MPLYVALVKYNRQKTPDEQLAVGKEARTIALEESGGVAAITTGSGYYGLFWTQGPADMILSFSRADEDAARASMKKLEERQSVTVSVFRALTEGEKERAVDGKPV
jgi:hypothetical protein